MSVLDTVDQLAKDQKVRTFDIYLLGPFLIWAAMQKKPLGYWTKKTLFVAGVMTVFYNWKAYRDAESEAQNVLKQL